MNDISAFANRLGKNIKHLMKWARREGIEAWRAYDRDIPQYPLAVDIYGERVHVQEYDTGWQLGEVAHRAWLDEIREAIVFVTGFSPEHIYFKVRRRQKGTRQYEKLTQEGEEFSVGEYGRRFWVNLEKYLDTGLFLDHRNTRRRVGTLAAGKRFLNLFAYTGSFSIYAATGGAVSSETVDLSNTYCAWAQRNFELNGIDTAQHRITRQDVRAWLAAAQAQQRQFDLIVMDPPSFSNSKKTPDILDIQRDHAALIEAAMRLLAEDGLLIFSNNLKSFVLDESLAARFHIQNVSQKSLPEDFRNQKIHQCFDIRHRRAEPNPALKAGTGVQAA